MDSLFFTLDDVRNVRKSVSVNIVDDFDNFATEAQINYVEGLIGSELYAELQRDLAAGVPQSQRFIDLIDGVTYTHSGRKVIYRGLKRYASYLWLHLFMGMGDVNHTVIGTRLFKDEEVSANEASQTRRNASAHYIKSASKLEDETIKFLSDNSTDYPEFSKSSRIEQAEADDFSFRVSDTKFSEVHNKFD